QAGARPRQRLRLARLEPDATGHPGGRRGVPRAPAGGGTLDRRRLPPRPRVRGPLRARGEADRAGRASRNLAHSSPPRRRADHRRRGRRHAGDSGRAARRPRPAQVLPRAVGRSERADRARKGERLMAFEELKQRMRVAWGAAPFENIEDALEVMHADLVARLDPQPGEKWLDVGCGPGAVGMRAAQAGADVTGVDLSDVMIETARRRAREEGLDIAYDVGDAESL